MFIIIIILIYNIYVTFEHWKIEIEMFWKLLNIVLTSTDDELSSATGYHNALPLEVHGSGYSQMHMISNTKAEKLVSLFNTIKL